MSTSEEETIKDNRRYCIRDDYKPNKVNLTLEQDGVVFWNEARVQASRLYQWPLYVLARQTIVEKGMNRVLDIGCGPAFKLMRLIDPVAKVYGIDQQSAVDYCRSTYRSGQFFVDNFESPSLYFSEEFDLIICSDVIEHLEDPGYLLEYIRRYCSERTLVLISTPDRDRVRGKNCTSCPQKEHIREWNSQEYVAYLTKSGFDVLDHFFLAPLRPGFSKTHLRHWYHQIRNRLPFNYNQAALCRLRQSSI